MRIPIIVVAACGLASSVHAQSRFVLADRDADSLFFLHDANGNGLIDEPGEVSLAFSAANAAGTLGIMTPTTLTARADGLTVLGDVVNRNVYLFRDWNRDGDFQDVGESAVVANATNASGVSFASPTGSAFDSSGTLYVVNAGTANGADGIYRLVDLTPDGDFQDAGEVTPFIGAGFFGAGNGPYGPQQLVFNPALPLSGFFRNSTTGLHGIYRFADTDQNGNCDNASELALFWGAGNGAGIEPGPGFALTFDAARPGALYTLQTATGGVDQLVRVRDGNGDDDAQDATESEVVFSTAEAGFIAVEVISRPNGQVLLTDSSGSRVFVLTDLDNDDKFLAANERALYFANANVLIGDVRQASPFPVLCRANCDGSTGLPQLTANDFQCFLNEFAAGSYYANCDSSSGTPLLTANDFQCFLNAFAAGCS